MTSIPLQFRVANMADIDALMALVQSAYRGETSRDGWTTEADLLDGQRTDAADIRACIGGERSMVLVAEQTNACATSANPIVACAHLTVLTDETTGDAGHFGMFAVRPQAQRGGVGKALLAEAERIARDEWQVPVMQMSVIDVRAELIAFYERRGYRRTGIHKPFPYGDERFGLPRRDDLRFEILEKRLQPASGKPTIQHTATRIPAA